MITKAQLNRWRRNPAAFIAEAVMVRGEDGRSRPVELWPIQVEALEQLGKPDRLGRFPWRTVWWCWPRRTGKSSLSRYLALWSFILWPNREVWFVSNSREQVFNVLFSDLRHDILASPVLLELVGGEGNVKAKEIVAEPLGSRCSLLPYDDSKAVGLKVDAGVLSEVWAMGGTEVYDALLVGTATTNGLILLDSTAPPAGSPWERILKDPPPETLVDWRGAEAYRLTPISEGILATFKRSMTPTEYKSKILNQCVEAQLHRLFTRKQIEACERDYPIPLPKAGLEELLQAELGERGYRLYVGLDRALGGPESDLTVLTALAAGINGDRRLAVVADQRVLDGSDGETIVGAIVEMLDRYGQGSVLLEAYSTIDIQQQLSKRGIAAELVHPTSKAQAEAFPILYAAVVNGEFIYSSQLTGLAEELLSFGHDPVRNRYGGLLKGKAGGIGDDRIYSLVWPLSAAFSQSVYVDPDLAVAGLPKWRHAREWHDRDEVTGLRFYEQELSLNGW